jgi:hypothetical protein
MKYISMLLGLILLLGIATDASAQSKIIKKTVKKVVTPQIAPVQPPKEEPSDEVVPEIPPPPPPPPDLDELIPQQDNGLLGWNMNADINGKLLFGSLVGGLRGDAIFSDPLLLGEKIGLAEDAVEYKVGLGAVIADTFKSIPLYADAVVYLKEGSLFGMDPYLGTGLIFNLYGTGKVSGGLGGQIYLGILADLGFGSRTGISVGYGTHQVGNDISDSGIQLAVTQPLRL